MSLTVADLHNRKARFSEQTARFARAGYERFGAPEFILDQARGMAGPVLDVGTGGGITARALARRGLEVVSVDMSGDDQEVAAFLTEDRACLERIHFQLADAAHLPVADAHFGGAVAIDVLHHLAAGGPVLRELLRVVKPGGLVLLSDFTADGFEMVSSVYAAEGLVHEEGPVTMDWARGFLSALEMTELTSTTGHFHRVAVFETPVPRAS